MQFEISTRINKPFRQEMKGMSREMLLQLNPSFPPFRIIHFDGIYEGAQVEIVLNLFLKKENWKYIISEVSGSETSWSFVDESIKQPFFLKSWKHRYTIRGNDSYIECTDRLEFRSPFLLLDLFLYPWLYMHFYYRKRVYPVIFGTL